MRLYASTTSPYARKVRAVICEKQLAVEFIPVTSADPRVAALNPLGKVPVFQRSDGTALFDSPVIVEYLDSLKSPALIPPASEKRWAVMRIAALADGMMDATVARTMEFRRPEAQRSAEVIRRQEEKMARAMKFSEHQLSDDSWWVDDAFTLADIAMVTALEYVDLRYPHAWKSDFRGLAAWLKQAATRPCFIDTQPPK
jgi:glutathione S-transferase